MREMLYILPPKIHFSNLHCSSYLTKAHVTTQQCKSKVGMRKLVYCLNDLKNFFFVNNLLKTAHIWPILNNFTLFFTPFTNTCTWLWRLRLVSFIRKQLLCIQTSNTDVYLEYNDVIMLADPPYGTYLVSYLRHIDQLLLWLQTDNRRIHKRFSSLTSSVNYREEMMPNFRLYKSMVWRGALSQIICFLSCHNPSQTVCLSLNLD